MSAKISSQGPYVRVRIDVGEVPGLAWLDQVPGSMRPRIVAGLLSETVRTGKAFELLNLLGFGNLLPSSTEGGAGPRPAGLAVGKAPLAAATSPSAGAGAQASRGETAPTAAVTGTSNSHVSPESEAPRPQLKGFFGESKAIQKNPKDHST